LAEGLGVFDELLFWVYNGLTLLKQLSLKQMLHINDIKKLIEYQLKAFKELFVTKGDWQKLEIKVDKIDMDVTTLKTDVFFLKEDVSAIKVTGKSLEAKIDKVQTSLDAVLKDKKTEDGEVAVLNYRMKKAEDFLDKAAPKLGLKFEH
jgi:hypothetical protein